MTTNPLLLQALLAMDAYNQGHAPGIKDVGSQIGEATLLVDCGDPGIFPDGATSVIP